MISWPLFYLFPFQIQFGKLNFHNLLSTSPPWGLQFSSAIIFKTLYQEHTPNYCLFSEHTPLAKPEFLFNFFILFFTM